MCNFISSRFIRMRCKMSFSTKRMRTVSADKSQASDAEDVLGPKWQKDSSVGYVKVSYCISHYIGLLSGTAYRRDRRCRTHSLGRKWHLATHSYESAAYEVTLLPRQLSFIKVSFLSPRAAMVPRGLRKNVQAISAAQKSEITCVSVRKV